MRSLRLRLRHVLALPATLLPERAGGPVCGSDLKKKKAVLLLLHGKMFPGKSIDTEQNGSVFLELVFDFCGEADIRVCAYRSLPGRAITGSSRIKIHQ